MEKEKVEMAHNKAKRTLLKLFV